MKPKDMSGDLLDKSHQDTDYTCGPAVLRAMIADTEDVYYPEKEIAKDAKTTKSDGTYPSMLLRAAKKLDPNVTSLSGLSKAQFNVLRRDRYLAILISTGPNYGHWVMVLPGQDEKIIIDDPWDNHYWSMTWDQLADCWKWRFPNGIEFYRMALISDYVPEADRPDISTLKIDPWNLPRLADFPKDYKWPARASS